MSETAALNIHRDAADVYYGHWEPVRSCNASHQRYRLLDFESADKKRKRGYDRPEDVYLAHFEIPRRARTSYRTSRITPTKSYSNPIFLSFNVQSDLHQVTNNFFEYDFLDCESMGNVQTKSHPLYNVQKYHTPLEAPFVWPTCPPPCPLSHSHSSVGISSSSALSYEPSYNLTRTSPTSKNSFQSKRMKLTSECFTLPLLSTSNHSECGCATTDAYQRSTTEEIPGTSVQESEGETSLPSFRSIFGALQTRTRLG
eukprot:TRINITY_DN7933_c0_g1_i2.p1 TRINITY_DN7933_c0_g1~~TRINITY_DN7933_c0_g1_i2.p1  ORF type:complete len:256 (-),score=-0.23 TRINITY_DN7933_c0_g1_i2:100-867(-)